MKDNDKVPPSTKNISKRFTVAKHKVYIYYVPTEVKVKNEGFDNNYVYNIYYLLQGKWFKYLFNDSKHNFKKNIKLKDTDLLETFYYHFGDVVAGTGDYEDFVSDYGYEEGTVESLRIYKVCHAGTEELRTVINNVDIHNIYEDLERQVLQ